MPDSVQPHRRQPTRLPRPWDSPGKNTGVGCHVLLQCMKVKSESEDAQSCPTLSNPMDCSLPGSSIGGDTPLQVGCHCLLQNLKQPYAKILGFPGGASGKESACQYRRYKRLGSIPRSERSHGEGNGNLLQYSCLRNPMDKGAWWATVHGTAELDVL